MKLSEFNYELPEELIAQVPIKNRDESRLLVLDRKSQTYEDKIFRDILQDKAEMTEFIRNFVQPNIKDELEQYKENYITKEYKYKQADVVYKVKGKEIYYLVEHQTKVDYSMPYRILNYCIEIIRHAVKNKETNKISYKYSAAVTVEFFSVESTNKMINKAS